MRYILVLAVISMTVATSLMYSEELALKYVWASSYAYCQDMPTDECGKAGEMVKDYGLEVLNFKQVGKYYNFINCVIFKDKKHKEIIVAFSGTQNPAQLTQQIVGNLPKSYKLHDIPGAKVLGFFQDNYLKFSDWLEDSIDDIGLKTYRLTFTGHSLGGALAVHAAMDMFLEEKRPADKMRLYTIG